VAMVASRDVRARNVCCTMIVPHTTGLWIKNLISIRDGV